MGFFSFGKRVKNKTFDYIPQHYDPVEEELRAKYAKYYAKEEHLSDAEASKLRIRSGLQQRSRASSEVKKKAEKAANIRLAVIIIALCVVAYYTMTSNAFEQFIKSILS